MKSLLYYCKNPGRIIHFAIDKMLHSSLGKQLSDKMFLKIMFRNQMGYRLNLDNPKTFNEKIQWLKLYERKDIYPIMVDKFLVKDYVSKLIGEKYVVPLLGVWSSFDEIDFSSLPEQFVLKTTHDCGGVVICQNKKCFDFEHAKEVLEKHLTCNYYHHCREWPYKNVKPRIIAEKYMVDESGVELKDYKIFCFNGKPMFIQVDFGRFTKHERNLYSTDWKYMGFSSLYPTNPNRVIEKPICLEKMLEIATILSAGIPHLRVDLYVINEKIYFGELTFHHGGGYEKFTPAEWDRRLGDLIDLSTVKEKTL